MIPRLTFNEPTKALYSDFLAALAQTLFSGDIRGDFSTRLIHSTDNSIYQILPQSVVFPKNQDDLQILFQLAAEPQFAKIRFAPRGGGTGTNGQSLTTGIIVDVSRHMNRILEVNLQAGWVRVEPGVVLDQLNDALSPHGVFFAPNLSPSSRATLGGMINTDACGKGSRVYGRTSDHVLELSCILSDGTSLHSIPLQLEQLEQRKQTPGIVGEIYRVVDQIVSEKSELIQKTFPSMSRFLTGYNLAKIYPEDRSHFNLNYMLSGSEGTLAIVHEAKLRLTPLPRYKQLLVVKYESFHEALAAAEILVQADPTAIETIDEKILTLAKEDEIYHKVKNFIADEGDRPTRTVNLVEFSGDQEEDILAKADSLSEAIAEKVEQPGEAIGYYRTRKAQEINNLWNLRKKGVGLLGNTKGQRKPLAFVEDTAVPPHNLAKYIQEFQALLDRYGLQYAMFGHVDVGCLHVRPALNLQNAKEEEWIRELSDQVVALVQKYQGIMWAEHGRGFRSEYTPLFFGEELYQDLRKIKEAFDPHNKLNPGKIVTPYSSQEEVVRIEAPLRGHRDRQISLKLQQEYEVTINCNGNGACYHYSPDYVMCPSSKITRDRIHSPKGRAGVMREWLRQLTLMQPTFPVAQKLHFGWRQWVLRWKNTQEKQKGEYDYSHEVYQAMAGCLACKACATQCPVHVDVPEFRAKFLAAYHTRYLRPLRDYLVGTTEWTAHWMSYSPRLFNFFLQQPFTSAILQKYARLLDAPLHSVPSLRQELRHRKASWATPKTLKMLSKEQKMKSVILLQDPFTTFYEVPLVLACYELLQKFGFSVYVTSYFPNGKPLHIKGFLPAFEKTVRRNVQYLRDLAKHQIPIICIEPSVALTYRDEYPKILGVPKLDFKVFLLQEWLLQQSAILQQHYLSEPQRSYQLLAHCTEKTFALLAEQQWQTIFQQLGISLQIADTGCCGMAGTYGHEAEHWEESRGIYEMSWKLCIPAAEQTRNTILITGYSCRSQVKRFEGFNPLHPMQALADELRIRAKERVKS